MPAVNFYAEEIKINLPEKQKLKKWIKNLIFEKGHKLGEVNIIFCNDDFLIKINQEYLDHDTYTDVITFDYCEEDIVSGDIFISWDRTKENAEMFHVEHIEEVHRIMIHGVLHLLGYKDKKSADKKIMTTEENSALKKLKEMI